MQPDPEFRCLNVGHYPGIPFGCGEAYNPGQESTYGSIGCSRSTHFVGFGGLRRLGGLQLDASASALAQVTLVNG